MGLEARIAELERRVAELELRKGTDFISPSQADAFLGLRSGTTSAAIKRGELRGHIRPGGKRYRVSIEELEEWRASW